MKIIYLISSIVIFLFFSCSKKNSYDLKVIQGIELGQNIDSLFKTYEQHDIKWESLINGSYFSNYYELSSNIIKLPTTYLFDFELYKNSKINQSHIGMLFAEYYGSNKNVHSMFVILASAAKPWSFTPSELKDAIGNTKCFSQEVNEFVLQEIEEQYTQKYGVPKKSKTNNPKIYVIENNNVKSYYGTTTKNEGELLEWETKYLKISFFKGYPSYTQTYSRKSNCYVMHWQIDGTNNIAPVIADVTIGEYSVFSYPIIIYEIKPEVIKELGLDVKPQLNI